MSDSNWIQHPGITPDEYNISNKKDDYYQSTCEVNGINVSCYRLRSDPKKIKMSNWIQHPGITPDEYNMSNKKDDYYQSTCEVNGNNVSCYRLRSDPRKSVGGGETQIEPKIPQKENKTKPPKIYSSQSSSLKNYFITK